MGEGATPPTAGESGPQRNGAKPRQATRPSIPIPPLGEWFKWLYTVLERFGLLKAAGKAVLVLAAALVIPLLSAWLLTVAAEFGDDYPYLGKARSWYLSTIQDGFQVLHSRIDYVHAFELELAGDKAPKWAVVTDLERGQHVEIVLRRIKVVPLEAAPAGRFSKVVAEGQQPSSTSRCSLVTPTKGGVRNSAGVLKVSLSGVPVRQDSFKETDETLSAVALDLEWWQNHRKELSKLRSFDLWFEAEQIATRTKPQGCGTLIVEGKIRVFKNRFSVSKE